MAQNLRSWHWWQFGDEGDGGQLVNGFVLEPDCDQNGALLHRQTLDQGSVIIPGISGIVTGIWD